MTGNAWEWLGSAPTRQRDNETARLRDYETARLRDCETAGLRDYETTGQRDNETTRPRDNGTPEKTQAFPGVLRRSQAFSGVRGSARQCVASWRQSGADTTLGEFGSDGLYFGVLPIADSNSLAAVDAPLSRQATPSKLFTLAHLIPFNLPRPNTQLKYRPAAK